MLRVLNDLVSTAIIEALQLPSGFKEFNEEFPLLTIHSLVKLDVTNFCFHFSATLGEKDESGQQNTISSACYHHHGLSSVKSIATAYARITNRPSNKKKIKPVLRHSP
ncbi:MAG: hypothetical protein P8130_10785 [Deltaproteobacteria bacterium]